MSSVARCITMIAVALVLVSAAHAQVGTETQPETDSAVSVPGDAVPADAQQHATLTLAARPSASLQPQDGSSGAPGATTTTWNETRDRTPKVEWFLGYSFWRAMPTSTSNRMGYLHGGSTSVAHNFNRYLGLVADFGGFDDSRLTLLNPAGGKTVNSGGSAYTFLAGPRFSYRKHERFTPFIQGLAGGAHASSVTISGCTGGASCTPLGTDNTFVAMFGTGLDIKVSRHVALRLIEGDFLLTHFADPVSTGGPTRGWQNNVRLTSGIVFRFGGNPTPEPITPMAASCSVDTDTVFAGSGNFVAVRAEANNPAQSPLTYSWSASEGAIDGTGSAVRWNSSGRAPGLYTIHARVTNDRGGAASCAVSIRVAQQPNRVPTIGCAVDPSSVTVGQVVEITATASDPDNDPLSFSWKPSAGRIDGSGSAVKFQTAGLSPGSYAIAGHVDDGRGGTAACAVNIDVQAAQLPAEVKELEIRLALHSIYFPTSRPTPTNPNGGLVDSQQTLLLALAADFGRYLTYKPQAHLVLEGHADRRGEVQFNQELTERRVERAKGFLVAHGVPAGNIETRALGMQDNLDAAQVQQLVEQNPDLNSEERQRIESHLQVIVWANNRRVDVSLNTTGQQSVRQYPFNAKDSLTLLSSKSGESDKSTTQHATRTAAKP
jgi:outer membrane protein OmpA-like peptidoglycan-associated protein